MAPRPANTLHSEDRPNHCPCPECGDAMNRQSKRCNRCALRSRSGGITVQCEYCTVPFLKPPSRNSVRNYCSGECQKKGAIGRANPNYRGGKPSFVCSVCAKVFSVYIGKASRKVCSLACRATLIKKYKTPETKIAAVRSNSRRAAIRRRSRLKPLRHHSEREWQELLDRHEQKCARCGTTDRITRDHIVPLAKGGTDEIDNIQPLCISCNCRKWTKTDGR